MPIRIVRVHRTFSRCPRLIFVPTDVTGSAAIPDRLMLGVRQVLVMVCIVSASFHRFSTFGGSLCVRSEIVCYLGWWCCILSYYPLTRTIMLVNNGVSSEK